MKIKSADGYKFTKISKHVLDHKIPEHLIVEALEAATVHPNIDSTGIAVISHDFGIPMGLNHCVEVDWSSDEVVWLTRPGRAGPTPHVRGRNPERTSIMTLVVSVYSGTVITAYFGPPAPREPWDHSLTAAQRLDSSKFWAHHALITRV